MGSSLMAKEIAIVQAIETAWADRTPVAWPNAQFDPPDNGDPWMQVDVLWGDSWPMSMGLAGTGTNDVAGLVQLTLYGRRDVGRGTLPWDAARDIFNRADVSGVRFGAASGPTPGNPNPAWESVIIRFPFSVEETL